MILIFCNPEFLLARASDDSHEELRKPNIAASIIIDGELDEPIWRTAKIFKNFKVTQPLSFNDAPNETQVLLASDEKGLYIGFINHQTENESISSHSSRDAEINSDYNEVIVDFDAQGVRAYGFKVSRTGAIQDSVWSEQNRVSTDWDADWQAATEIEEDVWTSEIFIPWSITVMTANDADTRQLKLYFSRRHQGKNQIFSYPAISPEQQLFMSHFEQQQLTFKATSSIDFFPYIAYNRDLEYANTEERVGIDIFWKPTASQQLNVTLNPDFGQVESEELVVNFSAIETFVSEKRPFFSENNDLFDLQGPQNLRLIHTPRIGASTEEDGAAKEILGALRYTQIDDKFDIGLLSAFENNNNGQIGNDFFASRLLYKQADYQLGLLHSITESQTSSRKSNVTTMDFQIETIEDIRLSGSYSKSLIETNLFTEDFIKEKKQDYGWWITSEWEPNDEQSHALTRLDYGELFDVSDFGFVSTVNRQQWQYEGSFQLADLNFEISDAKLRDLEWRWLVDHKNNKQKHDLPMTFELGLEVTFDSTRGFEFEIEQRQAGIDDLLTRGNNPIYFPAAKKYSIAYKSNQNSIFTYEIGFAQGQDFIDGDFNEIEFSPAFQLSENTDLSFDIEWIKNDSWVIWDEENILEEFKRDELSFAINFNANINNKHEIRLKLEAVALEAIALNEYETNEIGSLSISEEPPDSFSLSEFAAQLRYRYALSGLSELFIVYSRGGEFERERLGFDRSSLINRAINGDDTENLMVKWKLHF